MMLITGGVRSGKSTFAEQLAITQASNIGGQLQYIATGVPSDKEMRQRIERHKCERAEGKLAWQTWEKPVHIEALATSFNKNDIVLLDCVTTLLNNEIFSVSYEWDEAFLEEIYGRILDGIDAIRASCNQLILVSNEVLYEALYGNELVIQYSRILGNLHQEIVRRVEKAYLVEAGIPILMKGEKG